MMERIHVTVRPRPLSKEAKKSPWEIGSDTIFMGSSIPFKCDRIFREDCKTLEVYEARTKDIVAAAVRGFNGTVFAYGQTNSGKTHTMRGSPTEPGVIPLAVHDLFDTIYQDASREFLLRMSYLEIYNEDINDLLAPQQRKLQIHDNPEKGIFVDGLREVIVASPQQVLQMMEFGESHRHIGKTNMNMHSSRSHTIFRMIIESREKTQDDEGACDAVRASVLNLVDLAGSERASKTGAEGVRLKEGSHINRSLMALGTVIKKLSAGVENHGGHVPYRDSKLTRILQPALGGNANTAIICNISLAPIHADETKSSLQFASRAIRVTNCAHVNEGKRRDAWDSTSEVQSHVLSRASERETGPLLPFAELVTNERLYSISEQDENSIDETLEDSALPDSCALVNVTTRKKPSSIRQKIPVVVESESDRIQREYEDLFLQYETERITNEIQIECLKAMLGENDLSGEATCKHLYCRVVGNVHRDESSVHLIKQLQEKINMLETEKSSSKQELDDLVTIATEQNTSAREKIAEIEEEIHAAREEAQIARKQLVSKESEVNHVLNENVNFLVNVATEVEVLASEFQMFKASLETISLAMDEGLQDFAFFSPLIHDSTVNMRQSFEQHAALISSSYQNVQSCLKQKIVDTENEKVLLQEQCAGLQSQIEEPSQEAQKHGTSLMMLSTDHESERSDLLSHIECLEKDIVASLSTTSSLAKEKENLRGKQFWTPEEEEMLMMGVEKFAKANKNMPWKKILKMGKEVFHPTRSPADLKDKWRRTIAKAQQH